MASRNRKKKKHGEKPFSVFEIKIKKQYFPRRNGNKSRDFANKTRNTLQKLHDIELNLEFYFINIKSLKQILFSKKREIRPKNFFYYYNLKKNVLDFDREYENYCLRVYIYRETLRHFISEFLDIKGDKNFYNFLEDSKIRDLGIAKTLSSFDKIPLKEIISQRNGITHKLGGKDLNGKELEDVIKRFKKDLDNVNRSLTKVMKIHEEIAARINAYKEK